MAYMEDSLSYLDNLLQYDISSSPPPEGGIFLRGIISNNNNNTTLFYYASRRQQKLVSRWGVGKHITIKYVYISYAFKIKSITITVKYVYISYAFKIKSITCIHGISAIQ